MPSQYSKTPDSQPGAVAHRPRRLFAGNATFRMRALHGSERVLLSVGLLCVLAYFGARFYATTMSQASLWSFSELQSASSEAKHEEFEPSVDFSLWAGERVMAYKLALARRLGPPVAVLSIPRLQLDVPVFDGTDELTLNRGAGRIPGTASLGERGNIGIAAHRDGFFRRLKDVHPGDRIELAQLDHRFVYTVDNIAVVSPGDVTVLQARPQPSLTLVTCYPFYFIGEAPQRYIVKASLMSSEQVRSETDIETKLNKEKM